MSSLAQAAWWRSPARWRWTRPARWPARGDPAAQARQVFENLRRCLAAAGAGFADVIKLTYFVTDVAHLPAIRAVRDELLDADRLPASTAVQVSALVLPELLLEIEALALVAEAGA